MEVCWERLTPPDFKKLAKEEQLCILPIGVLERHGDHMPFGADGIICHEICERAAQKEPAVVFPTYWFGQVHEASCFAGAINYPTDFLCKMLEYTIEQIAKNGFKKILIISGHGGNGDFLRYFVMSQVDREVDYTLYLGFCYGEGRYSKLDIWDTGAGGHADEQETSLMMAAAEGTVKLEYQTVPERVKPRKDLAHLGNRIYNALWWYDHFRENVTGEPSAATKEKGEIALTAAVDDLADIIRTVKEDKALPELQKEFHRRIKEIKEYK